MHFKGRHFEREILLWAARLERLEKGVARAATLTTR